MGSTHSCQVIYQVSFTINCKAVYTSRIGSVRTWRLVCIGPGNRIGFFWVYFKCSRKCKKTTDSGLLIFTASYFSRQLVILTLLQPLMAYNYNLLNWPVCDFRQAVGLACGINTCLSELDQKSTRCFIRIHTGKRKTGCKVSRLVWLLEGIIVCNFLFYRCWSLKISTLKRESTYVTCVTS